MWYSSSKQIKSPRKKFNFNTGWLFYREDDIHSKSSGHSVKWESVILPHTVRLEPKEWVDSPSFQGISWYQRYFTVDPVYEGKKVFIQFEGAMINADVWVNGTHLISHKGGYLPFTIDISDIIYFGRENIIKVKVDSRDDWETPPGKPQKELDFVYFGGLYRNVHLIITDRLHITDEILANKVANGGVFITYPKVNRDEALVQVQANILNEYSKEKRVHIQTVMIERETEKIVASDQSSIRILPAGEDKTFVQTIKVENPKLWSMDCPNLYKLVINVLEENEKKDTYELQIGIRRIEFTADQGFFINGDRVLLNGVNHHEDYLYVGNAVSESMIYRDVKMIKKAGFNFIRAGHYPHHKAFTEACDEIGLAVVLPTPGWQYYTEKGEFSSRSIQMTREMVRVFRNHPSVIVWEPILNETWYPEDFAKAAYQAIHEEYPTDQAYAASDFGAPYGENFDVVYKEAYSETKPLITREWGDANHYIYDGERSSRKFGERSLINSSVHRQNSLKGNKWKDEKEEDGYWDWAGLNANQRISGYALWSFNDYNRGMSKEIAYSGIVDRDRYPKFNYYWFQSQQPPSENNNPMIFIANNWLESSPRDVHVYSNTEKVKLYLNDKLIGIKAHPKVKHIQNPIIIFRNIDWECGELKAVGLIGDKEIIEHSVRTPGSPHHLTIEFKNYGFKEMVANGSDMMICYIYVHDQNGNIVPTNKIDISLHLSGPGILIGNDEERVGANPVRVEAGIAAALIRSTLEPGDITVIASAPGLHYAKEVIKSIPYHGEFVPNPREEKKTSISRRSALQDYTITVSSEQNHHKGDNIINGNKNNHWISDVSDTDLWIFIDLNTNYNLTGMQMMWSTSNILIEYKIEVSDDQKNWILLVERKIQLEGEQDWSFERFASNTRFVRIHLLKSEKALGVREINIFGKITGQKNFLPKKKRVNIAAHKKTRASSYSVGNEPSMAVNQQLDTLWQAENFSLPQWLEVDFEELISISGVKILWGKDSTHYTYKIQVSKDRKNWVDVIEQTTTGSYYHSLNFYINNVQYIRIYIVNLMAGGGKEKVAIRELEVYSS